MKYDQIQGWVNFEDLYQAAVDEFDNCIFVEIGCWLGRSSICLAQKIKDSKKAIQLFCVDTWRLSSTVNLDDYFRDNYKDDRTRKLYQDMIAKYPEESMALAFHENVVAAGVDHIINQMVMTSEQASKTFADESLSFVFIDADHFDCANDIRYWLPKVKNGCILAGHDYTTWPSVKADVDRMLPDAKQVSGSSWLYRKT